MIFRGPVLEHSKKHVVFGETNFYMLVQTSCDGLMKRTYVLLKKERTNFLKLIVRTFLMKLAPGEIVRFYNRTLQCDRGCNKT